MQTHSSNEKLVSPTFRESFEQRILRLLQKFHTMEKEHPWLTRNLLIDTLNVWPLLRLAYFGNTCQKNGWKKRPEQYLLSSAPVNAEFLAALDQLPKGKPVLYAPAWYHVCNVANTLRREPTLDRLADSFTSMGKIFFKFWSDPWTFTEQPQYPGILLPPHEGFTQSNPASFTLQGYSAYTELALDYGLPVVRKEELFSMYCKMLSHAHYFKTYLQCLQSSAVFHVCYYEPAMMGLALACRTLGIPCVECQHGMQDGNHLMYEFPSIPEEGYDLVPEWFLQWGDISCEQLQYYFAHTTRHKALVGGRPPMALPPLPELESMIDALRKAIGQRKAILVTIQDSDVIPHSLKEHVLDAFDTAPNDWFWLLRDHPVAPALLPRTTSSCAYDRKLCSALPLEQVLNLTDHHVTWISSVAIEASSQGITTTIIGDYSNNAFRNLVDTGFVTRVHSSKDLLDNIYARLQDKNVKILNTHINLNPIQLNASLNVILSKKCY